jgi:putative inorganic carbon (HCO3(-)) transporter
MKEKYITIVLTIILFAVTMVSALSFHKLIALLIFGAVLLVLFLSNYKKITLDKKDIIILIFAALIFISSMLSSNVQKSIIGEEKRYEGMLTLYTYILIYFSAKKFLNFKNKKTLLAIFQIIYISICVLGILQYYIKINDITLFKKGVAGTFGNTNFMGSFLSFGFPIFILLYIVKNSKLSLLTSNLIFFCLIACGTRSAWVAAIFFALILLSYLIKMKNKEFFKRTAFLLILFALIFTYLFTAKSSFVKAKVNTVKKEVKTVATQGINKKMGSSRIQIWNITIDLIKKYPIFGVGTDNLKDALADNVTEEYYKYVKNSGTVLDKAHNEYLQIAVTLGIPALIIYLIFLFGILHGKYKLIFDNLPLFVVYSSILCYLVQAFFNISTIGVAPFFWFALGLIDNKMINNS